MYGRMVRYLSDRYYRQVSRYTTSAFMRMKLGETLSRRGLSAYVFETRREAVDFSKSRVNPTTIGKLMAASHRATEEQLLHRSRK
jgi:hypothetical protein